MSSHSISPNHREILSARSTITGNQEYLTSTSGALNINGSFTVTGGATSANQTNGQQLVQIVDAGGEAATVTGGKLDVNATASLAGSSIPISGATTAVGVAIVDGSGNQITTFGGGTQYTDGGVPPTHPIGNTIEWSDGTNWQTVSTAKPLPVAASLSAETTKVIGTVNQGTSPWVTSNATTSVIGNGAAATAQRVTLANDSTGSIATVGAVTAITNALPAGTNTIGKVGTTSAVVNVGQQTVNTTAVQISAVSTVPTNGIIVRALSTNTASIFVGDSGVTTTNGFELVAGESMSFTANLNTLYIRSAASASDKVCYNVE